AAPRPPGSSHTAVFDGTTNGMIVFGGRIFPTGATNDLWVLSNANGLGGTPVWTQLTPIGTPPSPRRGPRAIYDPATDRMTVFGGVNESSMEFKEVWVLKNTRSNPEWVQITPAGSSPAARDSSTLVYFPSSNQMTLFGGSSPFFNDVWVMSNPTGVDTTVTTNPPGLQITVDGTTATAPQTYTWGEGTSHTIAAPSPQGSGGSRSTFASWSDGGAQSHTVTGPSSATTFTANFATQY